MTNAGFEVSAAIVDASSRKRRMHRGTIKAARMSLATVLRQQRSPWASSSACTRGEPHVCRIASWIASIFPVSVLRRCCRCRRSIG